MQVMFHEEPECGLISQNKRPGLIKGFHVMGKKKRKTKKVKNPSEFRKQEMKKVTFSAGM